MKNIHVLPTNKPSKLQLQMNGNFHIENGQIIALRSYENIYITSDEEIKVGDWYLSIDNFMRKADVIWDNVYGKCPNKKIIITDNEDLIKDGVQAIDDEFLEWFVKNPNCEEVEIRKEYITPLGDIVETCYDNERLNYKIIIPKEEPKQETLEELKKWREEALIAHEINQKVIKKLMDEKKLMCSDEKIDKILQKIEEIKIMINIR